MFGFQSIDFTLLHVLLYIFTKSSNLSIYLFYGNEVIFFSTVLINLSEIADLHSLCVEYISIFFPQK